MSDDRRVRLVLDLDVRAEVITGAVRDGPGGDVPFVGWMALTRAIELAIEAGRSGGAPAASGR
jgi:hypothetical protein